MTSSTTSADAVKVLQGIRDVIAKADIMCLGAAGDSDGRAWPVRDEVVHDLTKAIATLSHHAEAGAVAWMYEYEDDGMTVVDLSIRPFRASWKSAKHATETPLFLHPAQPASQQGEEIVKLCHDGEPCPKVYGQQAHPTGDRVRLAKAVLAARSHLGAQRPDPEDDHEDAQQWDDLTAAAAALDQEKGR